MRIELFCHLPRVVVPTAADLELDGGARLRVLPFREWRLLEDPVVDYHERRYEAAAPAFFVSPLPADDATPGVLSSAAEIVASDLVERASIAALLAWPASLPPAPQLSIAYVRWSDLPAPADADAVDFEAASRDPADISTAGLSSAGQSRTIVALWEEASDGGPRLSYIERRAGFAAREWLFEEREPASTSSDDLTAYASAYSRLCTARAGKATPAIARLADVLRVGGEPSITADDLTALLVGALELVMNPGGAKPLAETFAARAAVLLARDAAGHEATRETLKELYARRSDILHGDAALEPSAVARNELLAMGWTALARVVRLAEATASEAKALDRLRQIASGKDADAAIEALHRELAKP